MSNTNGDTQSIAKSIVSISDSSKNLNRVPNIILVVTLVAFVASLFL